jgi:hypothetical protein
MEAAPLEAAEKGSIPILAAMMLIFLIGAGIAYMKWASDEGTENQYDRAAIQANYLAQTGIVERGFSYLRSLGPGNLPMGRIDLLSGGISGVGTYKDVYILRDYLHQESNVFRQTNHYSVFSTGMVTFENSKGEEIAVQRTRTLKVRLRSFAGYMYLTDFENTIFGERISFWREDTLWGRVHSNDQIAIMQNPVFYGLVTSCAEDFWHGGSYNPVFVNHLPVFEVAPILIPSEATKVRACAAGNNLTFYSEDRFQFRLAFNGDGFDIYRWDIGAPFPDSLPPMQSSPPLTDVAFFFYAPLEIKGVVLGSYTVGASEDIRLIDNVIYADSQPWGEVNPESENVLGIVSEGNIIIGDTWENGRENSAQGSDIIINAGMVALGESFTFEHQNDVWEIYQGPIPDDRGVIRLWGSVAQKRRGYVHRSNHTSTGYGKDYHYDDRFDITPPPCYPDATDDAGRSLFDIIAWGYGNE